MCVQKRKRRENEIYRGIERVENCRFDYKNNVASVKV